MMSRRVTGLRRTGGGVDVFMVYIGDRERSEFSQECVNSGLGGSINVIVSIRIWCKGRLCKADHPGEDSAERDNGTEAKPEVN